MATVKVEEPWVRHLMQTSYGLEFALEKKDACPNVFAVAHPFFYRLILTAPFSIPLPWIHDSTWLFELRRLYLYQRAPVCDMIDTFPNF